MSLAEKARARAAAIRAGKKDAPPTAKPRAEKKSDKPEKKKKVYHPRTSLKKARGNAAETETLRTKVLKMRKDDKGFAEIAEALGISDSYAWVLATGYKYQGKKKDKK